MEILEEINITSPGGLKELEMNEINSVGLWNCVQAAVSQGIIWALLPFLAPECHLQGNDRETGICLIQGTLYCWSNNSAVA